MPKKRNKTNNSYVTQADIARYCGVKQATVSRVLSGYPYISEETKHLVLNAVTALDYNPIVHDAARRLVFKRQGRTILNRTLAVILDEETIQYRFYSSILRGIWEIAEKHGYTIVIVNAMTDADTAGLTSLLIERGEIDGMIVVSFLEEIVSVEQILNRQENEIPDVPAIFCFIPPPTGCASIQVDQQHGGYLAAQHLLNLGHRHLLHYIYPATTAASPIMLRVMGACKALREWGLDPDKHLVQEPFTHMWNHPALLSAVAGWNPGFNLEKIYTKAAEEIADYFHLHSHITGIMAVNDSQAILTTYALRKAGLRIPEDISIIGFDDTDPLLNEYGHNTLTTIQLPLVEAGRQSASWMIRRIEAKDVSLNIPLLPVELIVRQTTATCREGASPI